MDDHEMLGLDARVERFLSNELVRAQDDLRRAPIPAGLGIRSDRRIWSDLRTVPIVVAAILGVVFIGSVLILRPTGPGGTTAPSGSPSSGPSARASGGAPAVVVDGGVPVSLDGEPILAGAAIEPARRDPAVRSFLVTGVLRNVIYDCPAGACPLDSVWVLHAPGSPIDVPTTGHVLLEPGATWSPPSADRWAGDLVVLRVRAYDVPCPWASFCRDTLLVEAWIPPD